jgi:hypothetical protein
MRVKKFGRTTGLTFGTAQAFAPSATPLPYHGENFRGTVWFRNFWIIEADEGEHFAMAGDSGALVVTEDASAAVGILFAASPRGNYAFMMPIKQVQQQFGGLALVSGHGI